MIARLIEEHAAIHALHADQAVGVASLADRLGHDAFAEAKATLVRLDWVIRSHFGSEEAEIDDALAYEQPF